ncbi:MAG: hypothetical protein KDJ20_06305, partial [Hyphomicrobiales bacterium]|nr:hypothetical protein [Hyphomicrobiales bacterium]
MLATFDCKLRTSAPYADPASSGQDGRGIYSLGRRQAREGVVMKRTILKTGAILAIGLAFTLDGAVAA